jgi:hypothetical protein
MTKSRLRGFHGFRRSDESFRSIVRRLRDARVIP